MTAGNDAAAILEYAADQMFALLLETNRTLPLMTSHSINAPSLAAANNPPAVRRKRDHVRRARNVRGK